MKYTVVLLYPHSLTGDYGADVYVETAEAKDLWKATKAVQRMAMRDNQECVEKNNVKIDDFRPVLVFTGDCEIVAAAPDFGPIPGWSWTSKD